MHDDEWSDDAEAWKGQAAAERERGNALEDALSAWVQAFAEPMPGLWHFGVGVPHRQRGCGERCTVQLGDFAGYRAITEAGTWMRLEYADSPNQPTGPRVPLADLAGIPVTSDPSVAKGTIRIHVARPGMGDGNA
jgi:hypothetical protein